MQEVEKRNKELLEEVEKLKRQIKALKSRKKYGLVWEEEKEPEQIVLDCQYKIPILKEVKSKEIVTDKEKSTNILIEGDNYHALSVLNYTHKRAVDVIYIDPPYNTGNEGFVYNDNRVDINDSYRHSKWLSFMEKRLKLAKSLLNSKGIIFISIDDNEQAQLKLLCDEIFKENNFIALIIIQTNKGGRDYLEIAKTHEYLLCYGKSPDIKLNEIPKDISFLKLEDESGKFELRELRNRNPKFTKENRPNLYYPIYVNPLLTDNYENCAVSLEKSKSYHIEVFPKNSEGKDSCWRWGKKLVFQNIVENDANKSQVVAKQKRDGGWNIYEKCRKSTTKAKSIWDESEVRTERGTIVLRNILGKALFDHPKPVELIDKILRLSTNENSIIIDFFAGSGTTAQAVLELNNQDEGNRKFILCTNNESNNGAGYKILSDICYPRIEKVIKGYKDLKNQKIEGTGGNLKYFKIEMIDIDHISHVSDEQKIKLTYQAGDMIALREGTFEEVEKNDWWQIFKDGTKYTAIYFKEDKSKLNELVKKLAKLKEKVVLYIFSWGKNEYKNEFTEYKNIKVEDIPEPIIDVYKEINRLS